MSKPTRKGARSAPPAVLTLGPVRVDRHNNAATIGDMPVHLTPKEARLLWTLMTQPNVPMSREELMRRVWDTTYTDDTRTLEVHMHWLRKKIEVDSRRPVFLRTVRKRGYMFVWPPTPSENTHRKR